MISNNVRIGKSLGQINQSNFIPHYQSSGILSKGQSRRGFTLFSFQNKDNPLEPDIGICTSSARAA